MINNRAAVQGEGQGVDSHRLRVPNVLYTKDERLSIHSVAPFSYSSIMQVY